MLIIEKVKVFNFEGAMRGLRNPKDSWHLSDSKYGNNFNKKLQEKCIIFLLFTNFNCYIKFS